MTYVYKISTGEIIDWHEGVATLNGLANDINFGYNENATGQEANISKLP